MARLLFTIGLILMALPFAIMGIEVVVAHAIGATGERMASAGFWGVFVGFFTFVPGLLLSIISGIVMIFED